MTLYKGNGTTPSDLLLNSICLENNSEIVPVFSGDHQLLLPTEWGGFPLHCYTTPGYGNILFRNTTAEDPGEVEFKDGNYTSLFMVMVQDPSDEENYAPMLATDHGFWAEKDIQSYGVFFTSSDPSKGVGGGAVVIGHGFEGANDPPRINLIDGVDSTLCITGGSTEANGVDPVLANMKLKDLTMHGELAIHCPSHSTWKIVSGTNNHLQFSISDSLKADIDQYGSLWLAGWLTVTGQSTFNNAVTMTAGLQARGGNFELRDNGTVDSTAVRVFNSSGNLYLQNGYPGCYIYFRNETAAVTASLSSSGHLTLSGRLYLTGSNNGYLWNNGGYIRQTGGNGIVADGTITVGTYGSSGVGSALYCNLNHQICQGTSLLEYKKNIEEVDDASWIYDLRPVTFDWKDDKEAEAFGRQIGLIAEEVQPYAPLLTFNDDQTGKLRGVMYEKLAIPILVELKKLKREVDELKAKLVAA